MLLLIILSQLTRNPNSLLQKYITPDPFHQTGKINKEEDIIPPTKSILLIQIPQQILKIHTKPNYQANLAHILEEEEKETSKKT